MKTRKLSLALAALLITSAAFVSSCRKHKTEDTDNDPTAAKDNNLAENTSNDVLNMAAQASENYTGTGTSSSLSTYRMGQPDEVSALGCADTVKVDTTIKLIRVHFNGSTTCLDGRTRSGVLLFDYSASPTGVRWYRNPGYSVHVTSQNYVVDGNSVTIDKTILNQGFVSGNLTWKITSNVTINLAGGGGTITWNTTRTKTLLNTSTAYTIGGSSCAPCYTNQSTPIDWSKAVIKIDGGASGVSAKGTAYSANAYGLIRNMNCSPAGHPFRHPFVQGTIDFTPAGKYTRHVDFGNGSCDLQYTVTINGHVYGPYDLP
ncbi:MAG: hypothetical protein ACXVPN_06750 [Bacteroidia bacterium]